MPEVLRLRRRVAVWASNDPHPFAEDPQGSEGQEMTRPSQSLIARARRARKRERMLDQAVRNITTRRSRELLLEHPFLAGYAICEAKLIRAEFLRLEREG